MNGKNLTIPSGREFEIRRNDDGSIPWTVLTNYPNQGFGADVMTVARVSLARRISSISDLKLISTVHDSIVLDVGDKLVDKAVKVVYSTFNDIPANMKKLWGIDSPIPFPCEVKVGKNLADMEEYEEH